MYLLRYYLMEHRKTLHLPCKTLAHVKSALKTRSVSQEDIADFLDNHTLTTPSTLYLLQEIEAYKPVYIVLNPETRELKAISKPRTGQRIYFCMTQELAQKVLSTAKQRGKKYYLGNIDKQYTPIPQALAHWMSKVDYMLTLDRQVIQGDVDALI